MSTMLVAANAAMSKQETMAQRLFLAWQLLQGVSGRRRSQAWLAEAVSKQMGLKGDQAWTQATVSRWFSGAEPPLKTIRALAVVLNVHCGWLAFGEDGGPGPEDPMRLGMRLR